MGDRPTDPWFWILLAAICITGSAVVWLVQPQ